MKKRCTSGHVNGKRIFLMLLAAVGPRCAVALGCAVASGLAKHIIRMRIGVLSPFPSEVAIGEMIHRHSFYYLLCPW